MSGGAEGDGGDDALVGTTASVVPGRNADISEISRPAGLLGTRLGRFRLVAELGRGGMGVVYEALDEAHQSRTALKSLGTMSADALALFKNEFRVLQGLRHPNLVSLGELFCDGGQWFFTMDLVRGVDFLTHVRDQGATAPDAVVSTVVASDGPTLPAPGTATTATMGASSAAPVAVRVAPPGAGSPSWSTTNEPKLRSALRQLASGLAALHGAQKVHRDVKPSNVLVTLDGRVVLLDFGVALEVLDAGYQASEQLPAGTVAYMSPEQASGRAGPASDWYSAGVMLYESLTGVLPFTGTLAQILTDKQLRDPPSPRALVPAVPEDLNDLCVRLMARDPAARPDVREILGLLGASEAPAAPRAASVLTPLAGTPFVGRWEELAALARAYDDVDRGGSVTLLVHGESGVGKSALVRQFTDGLVARNRAALVLAGRCYERESVPYKAFDGVVDELSRYLRRLPPGEAAALLPRRAALLPQVFPVLGRVAAVAEASRKPHGVLDPQELRGRVFEALREMLARITERRPLVLLVDDLQWTDVDSLALLGEILRPPEAPPLLFIATVRTSSAQASELSLFSRIPGDVRRLAVERLPRDDARELATLLVKRAAADTAMSAEELAEEAAGHPLFLDELVRHQAARGARPAGQVRLDDALWARASGLDPVARRVLELVALAGTPLAQEIVAEAAEIPFEALAGHASFLRAANLVRTSGARAADLVEPYHDRVREAVASRLEPEERRLLHERLASVLEISGQVDAELLSMHWRGAGALERAAHHAVLAADRASAALAFDRAARLYRLALELYATEQADTARRRDLQAQLGTALGNAGRGAEAAEAFREAAVGADAARALDLRRHAAQHLLTSGHVDEGIAVISEVLAAMGLKLAKTSWMALASMLFRRLLLWLRGLRFRERDASQISPKQLALVDLCWTLSIGITLVDTVRGFDFQTRHLLLALASGEPSRVVRALGIEVTAEAAMGAQARAAKLTRTVREIAERTGDPYHLAGADTAAGVAAYQEGRWKECVALCDRGESILRDRCTGSAGERASNRLFAIHALAWMGELGELAVRVPPIVNEALDRGDLWTVTSMRTSLANMVWLARDDAEGARNEIREAMLRWSHRGFHLQHYQALRAEMQIDLYRGDAEVARERLLESQPALERSMFTRGVRAIRSEVIDFRARIALAATAEATKRAPLLAAASAAARKLEREGLPWTRAVAQLVRAGHAAASGDREGALSRLAAAEEQLGAVDMALHAAAARRRRGELLGGDEGRVLVEAADGWMAQQKIVAPSRMTAMLAPGFPPRS